MQSAATAGPCLHDLTALSLLSETVLHLQGAIRKVLLRETIAPTVDTADLLQTLQLAIVGEIGQAGRGLSDEEVCTMFRIFGRQLALHILKVNASHASPKRLFRAA